MSLTEVKSSGGGEKSKDRVLWGAVAPEMVFSVELTRSRTEMREIMIVW